MVQSLSVPLFITSSICLLLSVFFILLYHRLTSRHEESVKYYFIFSLAAFVSSVFFGGFAMLLNSADNLLQLSIANRITVVAAMFTTVLSLHFYVSYLSIQSTNVFKMVLRDLRSFFATGGGAQPIFSR